MNIELVKLTPEYKTQLFDMLTEWKEDIEQNHTNQSPWMIFRNDFHVLSGKKKMAGSFIFNGNSGSLYSFQL